MNVRFAPFVDGERANRTSRRYGGGNRMLGATWTGDGRLYDPGGRSFSETTKPGRQTLRSKFSGDQPMSLTLSGGEYSGGQATQLMASVPFGETATFMAFL